MELFDADHYSASSPLNLCQSAAMMKRLSVRACQRICSAAAGTTQSHAPTAADQCYDEPSISSTGRQAEKENLCADEDEDDDNGVLSVWRRSGNQDWQRELDLEAVHFKVFRLSRSAQSGLAEAAAHNAQLKTP